MSDCTFCRIAEGEIPAHVVAENDEFMAFEDIRPRAPVHLLVIPREHVTSLEEMGALPHDLGGRMLKFIAEAARDAGVHDSGYRVICNTGPDSGQEIVHLHWHVIGGRRLGGMV